MKNLKLFVCSALFIIHFSFSYSQSWLWGVGGNRPLKSNDAGYAVATDKNDNAYVTGQFQTSIIFGPETLSCATFSAYLAKYDSSGNVIWANQVNDITGESYGTAVATDKSGNVCMAGYFYGSAQIGTFSLTCNNASSDPDFFVVKYNAAGIALWAKQSVAPPGNSDGNLSSIAIDKLGDVFITGYFQDTTSFGGITLKQQAAAAIFLL